MLVDTCPQAANHCAFFKFESVLKFYDLKAWNKFEFHFMQLHINKKKLCFFMNNERVTVMAK